MINRPYVGGGDVLLLSPGTPQHISHRLLFVRHFRPAQNSPVAIALGFGGKSHGQLTIWGVGAKATPVEPPYELETVRGILFAPPEITGENGFTALQPDEIDLSDFKAAPIIGESAEPFARQGDHILIREQDRIEPGQPLVDRRLYLLETTDGVVAVKRYNRQITGHYDALHFQPTALTLG